MDYRKPTQHHMGRRLPSHDYSRPGFYHITTRVADGMGQPLGALVGNDADSANVVLTPLGETVAHELTTAITAHYPMVTVDTFVIMPEHLHFILIVRDPIMSKTDRPAHLGQVIAGFKKGCNRAFWGDTGQQYPAGEPLGALYTPAATTAPGTPVSNTAPGIPAATTAPDGSPVGLRPPSNGSTGRPPLFAYGYCDVMPIEPGQLETQRAYIRNNPKSRWQRSHNRARLQTQRGGIDTAVTPAALRRFLQRECPPALATPEALDTIEHRLLLAGGHIACDSYGDRRLLQRRLLPVVCHRKDEARRKEQKARCLEEAARGAVLVSPRIAPGEQAIIDATANHGFPVILVADNGFPTIYHPSTERIALCGEGRLLLITPWQYQYRGKNEQVTVPFCKAMNCVAQAPCKTKDSWWKEAVPSGTAASDTALSGTAPSGSPAGTNPE